MTSSSYSSRPTLHMAKASWSQLPQVNPARFFFNARAGGSGESTGNSAGGVPAPLPEVLPLAILLPRLSNPYASCYVSPEDAAFSSYQFSLLGFGDVLMPGAFSFFFARVSYPHKEFSFRLIYPWIGNYDRPEFRSILLSR